MGEICGNGPVNITRVHMHTYTEVKKKKRLLYTYIYEGYLLFFRTNRWIHLVWKLEHLFNILFNNSVNKYIHLKKHRCSGIVDLLDAGY